MQRSLTGLAAALLSLCAFSCASPGVHLVMSDIEDGELGRLDVAFVDQEGELAGGPVSSHLYRVDETRPRLVLESESTTWTARDLSPGLYRIEVLEWVDTRGGIRTGGAARAFAIRPGEHVAAMVSLADVRTSVEPPDPVEETRETLTRVLPIVLEFVLRRH